MKMNENENHIQNKYKIQNHRFRKIETGGFVVKKRRNRRYRKSKP